MKAADDSRGLTRKHEGGAPRAAGGSAPSIVPPSRRESFERDIAMPAAADALSSSWRRSWVLRLSPQTRVTPEPPGFEAMLYGEDSTNEAGMEILRATT